MNHLRSVGTLALALLCAALFSTSADAATAQEVEQTFEQGKQAFEQGRTAEARDLLKDVWIWRNPQNQRQAHPLAADALYLVARTYDETERRPLREGELFHGKISTNWAVAERLYDAAMKVKPEVTEDVALRWAHMKLLLGDEQTAVQQLSEVQNQQADTAVGAAAEATLEAVDAGQDAKAAVAAGREAREAFGKPADEEATTAELPPLDGDLPQTLPPMEEPEPEDTEATEAPAEAPQDDVRSVPEVAPLQPAAPSPARVEADAVQPDPDYQASAHRLLNPTDLVIDGAVSEDKWRGEGAIELTNYPWYSPLLGTRQKTTVRMLYDDDKFLYVLIRAEEGGERKTYSRSRDDNSLWREERVGIVLQPESGGDRMFAIEVNPSGGFIDYEMNLEEQDGALMVETDEGWDAEGAFVVARWSGGDTGPSGEYRPQVYTVEMAIPFKALSSTDPRQGDTWAVGLFRVDMKQNELRGARPVYNMWRAPDTRRPELRTPAILGVLRFDSPKL